jgi:hypothetical protein
MEILVHDDCGFTTQWVTLQSRAAVSDLRFAFTLASVSMVFDISIAAIDASTFIDSQDIIPTLIYNLLWVKIRVGTVLA